LYSRFLNRNCNQLTPGGLALVISIGLTLCCLVGLGCFCIRGQISERIKKICNRQRPEEVPLPPEDWPELEEEGEEESRRNCLKHKAIAMPT